ncbi:A-kinase anchor protein 10, mitochondrial [Tribolium castaneum]|uniref:A-kinase anchor protein 10, mitochondrial-like Protein n=1 Tax=Tribolium castaneum TaxID=7070 RepID=D6X0R7_TRICA|nr:PREDICTED: A-kinase anchor protein 10, mitochondrial [Tribolium castaneum]EFA10548.1 A-kinase anchor protein 10, mitochondrial-like Protein [Tribolium castaneum]|eukprot:XP_971988.1 PREDICTED: A-kinase anchor protein 10, mitochondrial [Tribolium castaneum]
MLQFWRKSKAGNDTKCAAPAVTPRPRPPKPPPLDLDIDEFEATRSRLCRTLDEVLGDKGALGYFTQFMEARNAAKFINCWGDIESFKCEISTDCDSSDTQNSSDSCESSLVEGAVAIFKKYIAQESAHNVKCPESVRNELVENICDLEKIASCLDPVQSFVTEVMEKEYFEAFLASDYFCKYQIDVLTSGQVALDDILYNETALFYFMEFLEQENSCNLLEFWIAATNLQQHLTNQKEFFDPIEAQNDAVVLYDKYFSLQAHCPLGFGDKVRFEIEQNICGENGLVLDCFKLPLKIVEQVLEKNYLKPFLESQLFCKYLSELINTVQSNDYFNLENNRTLSSDCSSEKSFSTNSAFLALELNFNNNNCKKKDKNADMSIDTRQLCDPDSLWKRRRTHRLSCGRITALGKFETDLEPEPDRKSFKFKNVVKKFVSLDEDKRKEEMAWQVAEMIVKDITNVTLNQEKPSSSL